MKKVFEIKMKMPGIEKKAPVNKDGEYVARSLKGIKSFYDKTSKMLSISVEFDQDNYKRAYSMICDAFLRAYWYARENRLAGNEPMMLHAICQAQSIFFKSVCTSNAKSVMFSKNEDLEIYWCRNESETCKFKCNIKWIDKE